MKIVIADDDQIALELLQEALTDSSHEVEAAENGITAAHMLEDGEARVLICDWEMPGLSGPELCRHVRGKDLGRYVYVIMLTSRDKKSDLIEGLTAGADDFLTKPFDPAELSIRLKIAERVTSLETRDLVIFSMAKLVESRDEDTGKHLERVREYCRLLAVELMTHPQPGCNVDAEFIRYLYLTSPLHDIGKVGIPDAILLKSERLTEHEYEVMKTHTTIGAKTLEDALSQFPNATFLAVARDIAHAHHEKWDGTGYPRGLEGDAIPLAARVLALADVYDALRSRRPYKLPMTHEQASAVIEQGSGRHFDPRVIRAFQSVQSTFARIAEAMGDEQESLPLAA